MNLALTSTRLAAMFGACIKRLHAWSRAASHSQASPGAFGLLVGNRPEQR